MDTAQFLEAMYQGRGDGYAAVCYQKRTHNDEEDIEGTVGDFIAQGVKASNIPAMLVNIDEMNEHNRDVWFSLGTWKTKPTRNKRGSAADVVSIPGLWADIDCGIGTHKSKHNLPPTLDDGLALLVSPKPTIIVATGGGLHAYWLFDTPWLFDRGDPAPARLMEAWTRRIEGVGAVFGWHVDTSVSDLARVLRVPGTANYKTPVPREVDVIRETGERYEREYLAGLTDVARMPVPQQAGSIEWAYEALTPNKWAQ